MVNPFGAGPNNVPIDPLTESNIYGRLYAQQPYSNTAEVQQMVRQNQFLNRALRQAYVTQRQNLPKFIQEAIPSMMTGGSGPAFGTGLGQLGLYSAIPAILQANPNIMTDDQYKQFQQRNMRQI